MRTLHKDIVIIGVIFLAIGLVVGFWSEPMQFVGRGSPSDYVHPYWLTGLVLVVGGAIIAALGISTRNKGNVAHSQKEKICFMI